MKIAIAQITTHPGRIQDNTSKIISYIGDAHAAEAELIVFPELTIPGYCAMDLFLSDSYIEENIAALKDVVKASKDIKVIVGFVDVDRQRVRPDGKLLRYNSSAVIDNAKLIGLRDKTLLPEYDIFMEKRYFASSRQRGIIELDQTKIGLEICEDIYPVGYPVNVTQEYLEEGMELLINISASPFSIGKVETRFKWIKDALATRAIPVVYANAVGSFDGYEGELVFDGRSFIMNGSGTIIAQGRAFKEELLIAELPNDKVVVRYERDDIRDIHDALVLGIRAYCERNGFKRICLGISGGIDSAVVAALAIEAVGEKNVSLLAMPSEFSSEETRVDGKRVAKLLGTKFIEIPIQTLFEGFKSELGPKIYDEPVTGADTTYENIQSRIRGALLMAYANRTGGLLLNTGNKTELALGYCTLYGDMNGALSPLGDVSKERVYDLAKYINRRKERIPESIIERAPTAELKLNQTDEAGLGGPYSILSPLVDEIVEKEVDDGELKKRYPPHLVDSIRDKIIKSEFKRRQAPPAIRVTERAFGIGRRIPISY